MKTITEYIRNHVSTILGLLLVGLASWSFISNLAEVNEWSWVDIDVQVYFIVLGIALIRIPNKLISGLFDVIINRLKK